MERLWTSRGLQWRARAASQPLLPEILEEEPCEHGPGSNHVPCAQESPAHAIVGEQAQLPRVGTDAFGQSVLDVVA
jgi:hypothetical protein